MTLQKITGRGVQAVLIALLVSAMPLSAAERQMRADELLSLCRDGSPGCEMYLAGVRDGFFRGHAMTSMVCSRPPVEDVQAVFVDLVERNPFFRVFSAVDAIVAALQDTDPCYRYEPPFNRSTE